ncbi:MAG: alpha/beta hydrolase [Gammaproteobacteria bacterium]|nr:alpha/beta hydrolase [Gammaproteobacteria bacterium]
MTPWWEAHPGSGPFLLLVHGFLCSRAQWTPNLEALGAVCRPVVVELYGHGRSPSPEDVRAYAPASYVRALDAIRAELGAESWFVGGGSLGGALALRYALSRPEVVRGVAFTNSMAAFAPTDQVGQRMEEGARSAERVRMGGMEEIDRIRVHPRHARRLPREIHEALLEDARRLDPAGVANTVRYTTPRASVRDDLAAIRVPALLACGRFERRFRPHRDFAAARTPGLAVIDMDAGHAVNMQAADQFNRAVIDFVSDSVRTFDQMGSPAGHRHDGIDRPIEAT